MIPKEVLDKAKEEIREKGKYSFISKITRLKFDLQFFKDDIEFLCDEKSNKIIYACDYTEVCGYQKPEENIHHFLFDIEDPNEPDFINQKVIKRWYRLKKLFFSKERTTLIFPSHMEEIEDGICYLSQTSFDDMTNLSKIISDIKKVELTEDEFNKTKKLLDDIGKSRYVMTEENANELDGFFRKFSPQIASYALDNIIERKTRLERLANLLNEGNIEGVDTFDWGKYYEVNAETAKKIQSIKIEDETDKIDQLMELFNLIPLRNSLANFRDAQALVYIHKINSILKDAGHANVRVQMVSSALSMFTIDNALPDNYLCAYVRHPKFLAACLNAKDDIWKQIKRDHEKLIDMIDAFILRFEAPSFKGEKERFRHEISDEWQKLENAMFAREFDKDENKSNRETMLLENIKNETKKDLYADFLKFLRKEKSAVDKYVHQTFMVGFDVLIDVFVQKFLSQPLGNFNATYFDKIEEHPVPLRLMLESPGIRNIVEINDRQLIRKLAEGKKKGLRFGEIVCAIISDCEKLDSEFDLKLIKGLFMATTGNWKMVPTMCEYALEDKVGPSYEAYFIRHLALRKLVFEALTEKNEERRAKTYFSRALGDIKEAIKLKAQDPRYILSEIAMELEFICYPQLMPDRKVEQDIVSRQIKKCETLLTTLCDEENLYKQYMRLRCYQILISYFFADISGMIKIPNQHKIKEDIAKEWHIELLNLYENMTELNTNIYPGGHIVKNGCALIFNFDSLDRDKCAEIFDDIVKNCRKLSEKGFFKQITHGLKKYLLNKILERYSELEDRAKTDWKIVYTDIKKE